MPSENEKLMAYGRLVDSMIVDLREGEAMMAQAGLSGSAEPEATFALLNGDEFTITLKRGSNQDDD
jgi:hypothetical protein